VLTAAITPILGTAGPDGILGTPNDDSIFGFDGDDRLEGRAGNDDLDGGRGSDVLRGGTGNDVASYADAMEPVSVTLDDRSGDGAAGENDNVHTDVEGVYGGPGDDRLTGSDADNTLDGGAGSDTITGGAGSDGLYGGAGDDVVLAHDGAQDIVDCGAGADQYRADEELDRVDSSCERELPPVGSAGVAAIVVESFFGVQSGVSVRRACSAGIRLELRLNGKVLARAKARLKPEGRRCEFSKTFDVPRRKLGGATRVRCRLVYTGINGFGSRRWTITVSVPR
jgi:hypothetical protein